MITNPYNVNIPGTVIGKPQLPIKPVPQKQEMKPAEMDLSRGINFYADYSGCGFWRMIWPEHLLNAYQKMIVHGSTVMCFDENWYTNTKTIRIQRQATESQLKFIQYLRGIADKVGFKLVYEIDDIIFSEDIPHYNKFRGAFTDPKIRETAQTIMAHCD